MKLKVTSKGQIVPKEGSEGEDYICRLTLSDRGLVIEREEYLKENICLYDIPLRRITEFGFLNKKQKKKSILESCWVNLVGIISLVLSGVGVIHKEPKIPDILKISFRDDKNESIELIFDMMEFGECGLTKHYKKLVES